jgi:hypothetical protein
VSDPVSYTATLPIGESTEDIEIRARDRAFEQVRPVATPPPHLVVTTTDRFVPALAWDSWTRDC